MERLRAPRAASRESEAVPRCSTAFGLDGTASLESHDLYLANRASSIVEAPQGDHCYAATTRRASQKKLLE